jgi:hypothetical protein
LVGKYATETLGNRAVVFQTGVTSQSVDIDALYQFCKVFTLRYITREDAELEINATTVEGGVTTQLCFETGLTGNEANFIASHTR